MPAFQILKEPLAGDAILLTVRGFLDAHTFEELEKTITDIFEAGRFKIGVDLSGLDYISSAGAGVFIGAIGTAQENDGNIILMKPTANVKEGSDLLGLSQIFIFKETREEVLQTLK